MQYEGFVCIFVLWVNRLIPFDVSWYYINGNECTDQLL